MTLLYASLVRLFSHHNQGPAAILLDDGYHVHGTHVVTMIALLLRDFFSKTEVVVSEILRKQDSASINLIKNIWGYSSE